MAQHDEIAIVGVGCRFPGADNLSEYWSVLVNGENHVTEIPKERWNVDAFYDPDPNKPGKTYVRRAGFLNRFDEWDHRIFGVSEMEAAVMDPQQRIVLECVHMACEDGGITRKHLDSTHTGVYIGVMNNDYKKHASEDENLNSTYVVTGTNISIISARVSYVYNLLGPAVTVDTACSSSLVAINLGAQALKLGECDAAICGGVNILMDPSVFVVLSKARMLSRTGQCQTYSADADGYARSEGCGIVIIKRLTDAIRDGNKIWATLNTASNQDGHFATPITAPSERQQIDLLERIYKQSKVNRDTVQVIEAHGTGTPVGDPIEANALGTFFSNNKRSARTIHIGSVKSNIGHLESAAGVAGLIKVLLMMKYETIVPSLMYTVENENPKANLKKYGLVVPTECIRWTVPQNIIRTACVNSFGFGGTNAHAILQEVTPKPSTEYLNTLGTPSSTFFITLSASNHKSLKENVAQFLRYIMDNQVDLAPLSYTSTCRRDHFAERKAFVVDSKDELHKFCHDFLHEQPSLSKGTAQKKLVFVLCGVGTVWNEMGTSLMNIEAFADAIREIDTILLPLVGWSIATKLSRKEDILKDPLVAHIAIFAYQIGLASYWKQLGICPNAVVGQSVGEVAAAYIAGKIDLLSAVNIIYFRSKLLSEVSGGAMAVVRDITTDEIQDYCTSQKKSLSIAVFNSPISCTVSGDYEAILSMKTHFKNLGKGQIKELAVNCAYHSPRVEPVVNKLVAKLQRLKGTFSEVEIFSTVTGKKENGWCFATGKYWGKNIRMPVLFNNAIKAAVAPSGTTVFLEIGPGPVLHTHAHTLFENSTNTDVLASVTVGKAIQTIRQTICKLYEYGYNIMWENIVAKTDVIPLPRFLFLKNKTLYQNQTMRMQNQGVGVGSTAHLYIERIEDIHDLPQFVAKIDHEKTPFVYEHLVKGDVIVPGAFHADIGFEIGKTIFGLPSEHMSVSVQFLRPIRVDKHGPNTLYTTSENRGHECSFLVKQGQTAVCKGKVSKIDPLATHIALIRINEIKQHFENGKQLDQSELYLRLEEYGFQYGNSFKVMKQCIVNEEACLVELEIPSEVLVEGHRTTLHPCILDGVFQSTTAIVDKDFFRDTNQKRLTFLPVAVDSVSIQRKPVRKMFLYTKQTNMTVLDTVLKLHFDGTLLDSEGHLVASVKNYTTYTKRTPNNTPDELKYCLAWELAPSFGSSESARFLLLTNSTDDHFLQELQSNSTIICHPQSSEIDYQDFLSSATEVCRARWASDGGLDAIAVIFEGYNIQNVTNETEAEHIFQTAIENCWFLVELIRYLDLENIQKPIFAVTQNTQNCYDLDDSCTVEISGSEVWGFLRSVQIEFVQNHITLIDISPGLNETKNTLLSFMGVAVENEIATEIRICNNKVYTSAFSTSVASELTPIFRNVHYRRNIGYSFRSKTASYVSETHLLSDGRPFQQRHGNPIGNEIALRVKSVYIHSPNMYPSTLTSWKLGPHHLDNHQEEGHVVWAVEFTGYKINSSNTHIFKCGSSRIEPEVETSENEWEWIAIFPAEMKSIVVVPKDCTVSMKELPFYENGLVIKSIFSWAISEAVPMRSKVMVKLDNGDFTFRYLLQKMLSTRRKAIVQEEHESVDVVLVIYTENLKYPTLLRGSKVVSLKHAIPADFYQRLAVQGKVKIKEIDATDIIRRENISRILRKVVPWLKTNFCRSGHEEQTKHDRSNDVDSRAIETLSLPCMLHQTCVFDKFGTYIISGGLTGLGWELLLLMAEMGAGLIATFNRRALSSAKAAEIEAIQKKHACKVFCIQTDVNKLESVTNAIKLIKSYPGAGPIRGCFHGAGTLEPALLINVKKEQLDNVMRAKILGTLNMHIATNHLNLDFFILQSSITSIIGQVGQANYGAANSFLDAFAQWRRSKGLAAQAINWGALEVGMAANTDFSNNFEKRGYHLLTVMEIRCCFQQAIMQNSTGAVYTNIDWHLVAKDYFSSPQMSRLKAKMKTVFEEKLTANNQEDNSDIKGGFDIESLRKTDPIQQREALVLLVQAVAKRVLGNEIESHSITSTFADVGLDSMSSVTFANVVYDLTRCRIDQHFMLDPAHTFEDVVKYLTEELFEIGDSKDEKE